ncbi:hypothetical protein J5N97_018309 [Dioscorea zingiberensis]|uniref:AMP-dependent synthetase/ligase domain-containing protein n=1 Tax=Dioscorea zingiberensis TaxID=325984 RepID=A0A9D5CP05_9LILI|nr:hypothetical protein J5N97_018309 [Dioscorea zingiberensis]
MRGFPSPTLRSSLSKKLAVKDSIASAPIDVKLAKDRFVRKVLVELLWRIGPVVLSVELVNEIRSSGCWITEDLLCVLMCSWGRLGLDETYDPVSLYNAISEGAVYYKAFLQTGDPDFAWKPPKNEWQNIALVYTSGNTSNPKGVVRHHRGAYLMSLSGALSLGMNERTVYLWILRMFHCNAIAKHGVTVLGFRVNNTYGLSVTYGPSTVCAWKPEWDQPPPETRAKLHCRQGVQYLALENLNVDVKTMAPVPADGVTLGEIVMRGNGVMTEPQGQ